MFLPGLAEPALIEHAVQGSPLPVNIMVADRTSIPALSALGVARISYGPNPWRALMKLLEDAARAANLCVDPDRGLMRIHPRGRGSDP